MILGIYGSGGLGCEIFDLAKQINADKKTWEKTVFINDFDRHSSIEGSEILTFEEFQVAYPQNRAEIVIGVGEPKVREVLRQKVIAKGYSLGLLIHPSAFIGTQTHVAAGCIVQYGSFISCNVSVGENVLLQPHASIGHDSNIGNDSVISSFVSISGNCAIGARAYLAPGIPVKEKISVGSDSIIGMGAVVVRDIPGNCIALGNPARPMKNNNENQVFK